MKKFELVIPAYNEEKNIELLIERVVKAAKEASMTPQIFSLILVENGSRDNSLEVMNEVIAKNSWGEWVRVVQVPENRGYGHGILAGLHETTADVIGWTHADLQCDPKNAFAGHKLFVEQQRRDTLVKGWRVGRAWRERFVSAFFAFCARLILGLKFEEINAQPKIFPRELLDEMKNPPADFSLDLYLMYCAQKAGYQTVAFDVKFPPRIHGVSKWAAHFLSRYKTILKTILYMFHLRATEGKA